MTGQPASLRQLNRRLVFGRLLRHGPASKAQLAKAVGLSAPTVGKVVDELIADRLVELSDAAVCMTDGQATADTAQAAVGRPAQPVRLNRTTPSLIALQIGIRHTRVAALPVAGPMDDH